VIDLFTQEPIDPRVNKLESKLPEGSKMIFNDGDTQVVEVTEPEAACHFGKGTKWCTSDESTAKQYLDSAPLYVIFLKGKKYAQLHLSGTSTQIMDLRDRPIKIDDQVRAILIKTGFFQKPFEKLAEEGKWGLESENDLRYAFDDFLPFWTGWVGRKEYTGLEEVLMSSPSLSYAYAHDIVKKRVPELEDIISTNAITSLEYARNVLGNRFELGEEMIIHEGYGNKYASFLESANPTAFRTFLDDHDYERGLDKFRFYLFDQYLQVEGAEFQKTSNFRYDPDRRGIVVEYAYWDEEEQVYEYIWLDESGKEVKKETRNELNQLIS